MKSDSNHLNKEKFIHVYPLNKYQHTLQTFCGENELMKEMSSPTKKKWTYSCLNPLVSDDFIGRDIEDWVDFNLKKKSTTSEPSPNSLYKEIYVEGVVNEFYFNCIDWIENSLVVGLGNTVFVVNVITNESCQLIPDNELFSISCVKKKEKTKILLGDCDGFLSVIDLEENKIATRERSHSDRIGRIVCEGDMIITGSRDKTVNYFDQRSSFKHCFDTTTVSGEVCGLILKDNLLGIGTSSHVVYVYDIRFNYMPINVDYYHKSAVKALSFDIQRNNIILSGGGIRDKVVERWNFLTDERSFLETDSQIISIDYENKKEYILVSLGYPTNGFLQLDYGLNVVRKFDGHEGRILSTAGFSTHEERLFASLGSDCVLNVWKFL